MRERKLPLIRADLFKDKHEGSITNPMSRTQKKQFEEKLFNIETLSNWRRQLKECTFISCWCMGTNDSDAMWRLYGGEEEGVAITATYQKLEAALPHSSFRMAPVKYIDYQNDGFPQDNYYYPFFHKRLAYAHESEVRIILVGTDQFDDGSMPTSFSGLPIDEQRQLREKERQLKAQRKAERGTVIHIECDFINTIRDIVVHPDASDWYYVVVKEVVEKFVPELGQRVRWSSLRSPALY